MSPVGMAHPSRAEAIWRAEAAARRPDPHQTRRPKRNPGETSRREPL